MKTRIIAIVFGILVSASAFAQRGGRSPEERAERMTVRLTEKLALSEEQSAEVKDIYLNHMQEGKEKAEEASTREDKRAVMKEQQSAIEEELKAVFSEEQFQQYVSMKEEMKSRQGKRRERQKS